MRIKLGYPEYPSGIRTLSFHELLSLPKDTLLWLPRTYGLVKYQGPDTKNINLSQSINATSYYIDKKNQTIDFPLPTDNNPLTYSSFIFERLVDPYRLYPSSGYVDTITWNTARNSGVYLLEDNLLQKIIAPFMPALDCFSKALEMNKELKVI